MEHSRNLDIKIKQNVQQIHSMKFNIKAHIQQKL